MDVAFFTNSLKCRRNPMREECSGVEALFVAVGGVSWKLALRVLLRILTAHGGSGYSIGF